jgi:anaerobilin synthase
MDKPWGFFDSRIRSAMIARRNLPYLKISKDKNPNLINYLFQHKAQNSDRVIYIHIPFCNNVCPFCIYHKQKISDIKIISDYFNVVDKQIRALGSTEWVDSAPFKAIYFGGGTPTSVSVEYLESILNELKGNYKLTRDCEITVESTITDLNPTMVSRLKNAGVNRISLGVQSFNSVVRAKLGRSASQEQITETIAFVHDMGISNICIDLMYNLMDQDFGIWQNDLAYLKNSLITGCSVYPLISAYNLANPYEIAEIKIFETEYKYFIEADNYLVEKKGWDRLTSVQYGHRENGKAVYVAAQGQNADILAFGSGAGGRIGNINFLQTGNIEEYVNGNGDFLNDSILFLSINESFLRFRDIYGLSESLSLKKIDFNRLKEYFNDIILKLKDEGLIDSDDKSLFLTQAGRFWAANISAMFTERIRYLILQMEEVN